MYKLINAWKQNMQGNIVNHGETFLLEKRVWLEGDLDTTYSFLLYIHLNIAFISSSSFTL